MKTCYPVRFSLSAPARSMIVKTALLDLELTTPLPFLGTSRMFMMHCDRLQVQTKKESDLNDHKKEKLYA